MSDYLNKLLATNADYDEIHQEQRLRTWFSYHWVPQGTMYTAALFTVVPGHFLGNAEAERRKSQLLARWLKIAETVRKIAAEKCRSLGVDPEHFMQFGDMMPQSYARFLTEFTWGELTSEIGPHGLNSPNSEMASKESGMCFVEIRHMFVDTHPDEELDRVVNPENFDGGFWVDAGRLVWNPKVQLLERKLYAHYGMG